ncbi:MAG: 4Fe-4S single cluster domain-containing protein [Clostridia bacterium]
MSGDVSLGFFHSAVTVLGYGSRVGLWLSGCNRHCKFCETPELQGFNFSNEANEVISRCVVALQNGADGLTISGGEPFEQTAFLRKLLESAQKYTKDILVFTGYTLENLKERKDEDTDVALGYIGVLVDGEYIDDLNNGRGLRGSSNQTIHRLNPALIERYRGAEDWDRKIQIIYMSEQAGYIGINKKRGSCK